MFDGYLRTAQLNAVECYRMRTLIKYVRQEAQCGEAIPSAAALYAAKTAESLVAAIADAAGETVEQTRTELEHGFYLLTSEQAAKAIFCDVSGHIWYSDDLRLRAEEARHPGELEALFAMNRSLAIADNYSKEVYIPS